MFTKFTCFGIAAALIFSGAACERHTAEETKWFTQGHHGHGDDHADDAHAGDGTGQHGEAAEGGGDPRAGEHLPTERSDNAGEPVKESKRFIDR